MLEFLRFWVAVLVLMVHFIIGSTSRKYLFINKMVNTVHNCAEGCFVYSWLSLFIMIVLVLGGIWMYMTV